MSHVTFNGAVYRSSQSNFVFHFIDVVSTISASKLYKSKALRVARSHSVVCFRSRLIMRIFIVMALSLIALSHGNNDAAAGHFVNKLVRVINFHIFSPKIYSSATLIKRTDRMRHFWSQFILGGTEVEDFSQFAYQLSMRYVEFHVCGASIIALNWALTAGCALSFM